MKVTPDCLYAQNFDELVPVRWDSIVKIEVYYRGPKAYIYTENGGKIQENMTAVKKLTEMVKRYLHNTVEFENDANWREKIILNVDKVDWEATSKQPGFSKLTSLKSLKVVLKINDKQERNVVMPSNVFLSMVSTVQKQGKCIPSLREGIYVVYGLNDVSDTLDFDKIAVFGVNDRSIKVAGFSSDGTRVIWSWFNGGSFFSMAEYLKTQADNFVFACSPETGCSWFVRREFVDFESMDSRVGNRNCELSSVGVTKTKFPLCVVNRQGTHAMIDNAFLDEHEYERIKQRCAGRSPFLPGEIVLLEKREKGPEIARDMISSFVAENGKDEFVTGVCLESFGLKDQQLLDYKDTYFKDDKINREATAEQVRGIGLFCRADFYSNTYGLESESDARVVLNTRNSNCRANMHGAETNEMIKIIRGEVPEWASFDKGYLWSALGRIPLGDIVAISGLTDEKGDRDFIQAFFLFGCGVIEGVIQARVARRILDRKSFSFEVHDLYELEFSSPRRMHVNMDNIDLMDLGTWQVPFGNLNEKDLFVPIKLKGNHGYMKYVWKKEELKK